MKFNKIILRKPDDNKLDNLITGLVDNMDFSDSSVKYPELDEVEPNDGVDPDWFIPACSGISPDSERTAINQYVTQNSKYDKLGDILLGIGITEMKHLDEIGDLITKLGGTLENKWDNSAAEYGVDIQTAVLADIEGEKAAINFYEELLYKLSSVDTKTSEICQQLINKLLADEKFHLELLEKIFNYLKYGRIEI